MGPTGEPPAIETLWLVGLGPLPPGLAVEVVARLSSRVRAACRLEVGDRQPELPRVRGRDQIDADGLLERLEARPLEAGTVVVGLTARDIAIPIFTFVFGRARSPGRAAVVSAARLDPAFYGLPPDPERTARRTTDEILHELGHVAGLHHCDEPSCLMRFVGSVEHVDARGSAFCAPCEARLPDGLR
jgi:archaemetzincin